MTGPLPADDPFVCPVCEKRSWHPKDKEHGYCNACKVCTGDPQVLALLQHWRAEQAWEEMPANVARVWRPAGIVEAV